MKRILTLLFIFSSCIIKANILFYDKIDNTDLTAVKLTTNSDIQQKVKISKDIFGNTIIEDNQGNKTTISKDIFENTIIEVNKGGIKKISEVISGNRVIVFNK